jgi:predicted anti-sigma-YlaC factor YlaD
MLTDQAFEQRLAAEREKVLPTAAYEIAEELRRIESEVSDAIGMSSEAAKAIQRVDTVKSQLASSELLPQLKESIRKCVSASIPQPAATTTEPPAPIADRQANTELSDEIGMLVGRIDRLTQPFSQYDENSTFTMEGFRKALHYNSDDFGPSRFSARCSDLNLDEIDSAFSKLRATAEDAASDIRDRAKTAQANSEKFQALLRERKKKILESAVSSQSVVSQLWLLILEIGGLSVLIMWIVGLQPKAIQRDWTKDGRVIQFMTVAVLLISILGLGLASILKENTLGTLLGGIAGYVLAPRPREGSERSGTTADPQSGSPPPIGEDLLVSDTAATERQTEGITSPQSSSSERTQVSRASATNERSNSHIVSALASILLGIFSIQLWGTPVPLRSICYGTCVTLASVGAARLYRRIFMSSSPGFSRALIGELLAWGIGLAILMLATIRWVSAQATLEAGWLLAGLAIFAATTSVQIRNALRTSSDPGTHVASTTVIGN